jgi:uncharacterized protein YndB with AHSA1/START domain
MNTEAVRLTQPIRASAAEAYRAFTRSLVLREWMCDGAVVDAQPGGHLHVWWHSGYYATGEFTALEPERRVAFTWLGRGEPGATTVEVVLTPLPDGVEIVLTHDGFGAGEAWANVRFASRDGWTEGMENLKSVLETGQDLRYVLRPLLGIYADEFNTQIAARLGVPVSAGLRLSGVVPGLGAAGAGLQSDDVIVSLAGQPVADYPSLLAALGPQRAGDRVEVVFYRGGERRATAMTLSRRPIPAVPATPGELAEAVRHANASAYAELARILEGANDEQASRRPAPGEWNALETLAHLISHERELQIWITDLLCDDERWSDRFENTEVIYARLAAIVRGQPGLAGMLGELRRSQEETADMLAALPAEFVAHRGTYWRLGRSLLEGVQPPNHVQEHTAQIQSAIN